MNIIADVAGQYDALMRLVKKLPSGPLVFLGDLVDRGPDSAKVVEFAMSHMAVMGNHEHMMLDYVLNDGNPKVYDQHIWFYNGGLATLQSYGCDEMSPKIPEYELNWLSNLPLFIRTDRVFISHAMQDASGGDLLWNRHEPFQRDTLQVCGHNSHWGLRYFNREDGRPYAICLDDSRKKVLTALNLETMKIYQEAF